MKWDLVRQVGHGISKALNVSFVVYQSQEALLKKKLQMFLSEMLKMGTVKGFKYFAMYMRGREEMVLSVVNQPQVSDSFTILGLWVLGLVVPKTNESHCKRMSPEHYFS